MYEYAIYERVCEMDEYFVLYFISKYSNMHKNALLNFFAEIILKSKIKFQYFFKNIPRLYLAVQSI